MFRSILAIAFFLFFAIFSNTVFAITYDDATNIIPQKAYTHDIIAVPTAQVAKYCNFNNTIIEMPANFRKGNARYYECTYIGEKRQAR